MFTGPAEIYDRFVGRYSPGARRVRCARRRASRAGSARSTSAAAPGALVGGADRASRRRERRRNRPVRAVRRGRSGQGAGRAHRGRVGRVAPLRRRRVRRDAVPARRQLPRPIPSWACGRWSRVTRPGGVVAGCVWDYGGEMTMLRTFWDAAAALDPERADGTMESHDAFCEARTCSPRCGGDPDWSPTSRSRRSIVEASYEDFDDLWAPFPAGVGPGRARTPPRSTPRRRSRFATSSSAASAGPTARSHSPPGPGAPSGESARRPGARQGRHGAVGRENAGRETTARRRKIDSLRSPAPSSSSPRSSDSRATASSVSASS